MSNSIPLSQVSSLEAIINSIQFDPQVGRWFSLLIEQPVVQEKLKEANPSIKNDYSALRKIVGLQIFLNIVSLLSLCLYCWSKKYFYLLPLLPLIYSTLKILSQKKILRGQISRQLLVLDFPGDSLPSKSLYQIAETYSRIYQIPSLVDTIYHWDRIFPMALVICYFGINAIWPLQLWQQFLAIAVTMLFIPAIIKLNIVYKKLK